MKKMDEIKISVLAACTLVIFLVAPLMLAGIAMGEIPENGPVAEWHFDEGSGNFANDSSGNRNDGTVYGAIFVDGKFGKALSFDGENDYIDVEESNSLKITGDQLTMIAWINATGNAGPNNIIFNKEGEYEFGITNNKSGLVKNNSVWWAVANTNPGWYSQYPNYAINLNEWFFIVVVYDRNSVKTYINGILVHSLAASGTIGDQHSNWNKLWIGWRQSQIVKPFKGLIDEVYIYNRALSSEEIKANYEAGQIIVTASPTGTEVLVDGASKGTAPVTIPHVSPGSHAVKCKLSGYSNYDTSAIVTLGSTSSVICSLTPDSSKKAVITGKVMDVETDDPVQGATVNVDGKSTTTGSNGEYELSVDIGKHNLSVSKSGYETMTRSMIVPELGNVFYASLTPASGDTPFWIFIILIIVIVATCIIYLYSC